MNFKESLVARLKEVLIQGEWVAGTNFKEQIIALDWRDAIQKVANLNSIADLTFHITYYISGVANVLEGGSLEIKDRYSFEYPDVQSDLEWKSMIEKFCADSERFIGLLENMDEEKLFDNFVDQKYGDFYRNINVIIEHTYYHLGQILLIKKLIKDN